MCDVARVLLNGIFAFLMLFVLAKLLGKKQIAELNFADYAIGISLGSIAAEWATDVVNPWHFYALGMGVFFALSLAITLLQRKAPLFKRMLHGSPLVLVSDGKLDYQNLKRSKLSANDVLGMCRAQGYFDMKDVAFAVLETTGDLSVMPKDSQKPAVRSDLDLPPEKAQMICYLVVDGRIFKEGLDEIGKDENWLFERLGVENKRQLKNFLLVSFDREANSLDVQIKNKRTFAKQTK